MDYRTESFTRRFASALPHLLASDMQQIVSIKYRDDCVSNSVYDRLADDIGPHGMSLDVQPLSGEFGGRAWLAKSENGGRAILIEHETGLEILGVVGSVASLISLIPLISSGWRRLRGRFFGHHFDPASEGLVEVRRIDDHGMVVEERVPSVEIYVFNLTLQRQNQLEKKIVDLEREVESLRKLPAPKKARRSKPKRKKN